MEILKMEKKRTKSKSFSEEEEEVLINLAVKYKKVLENKCTGVVINK